jgi:NADH-quinone oxidoreductase subunit J
MTLDLSGLLLAALILVPAFLVVGGRNLVHSVLWLGFTLVATAALYVRLAAPFVAAVQLLLYAGGVLVLLVFGVMLTRRVEGSYVPASHGSPLRGLSVALPLFGILAWAIVATPELAPPSAQVTVSDVSQALFTDFVLAFEVLGVLLLAGMVGAIVIARRRDPGQAGEGA